MGWAKSARRTGGWGGFASIAALAAAANIPLMGFSVPDSELDDAYPGLTAEVASYVAAGVKRVRFDFRQSNLGGGSYTTQDARVAAVRAAGIEILGILNPNTNLDDSTKRTGYASYCGTIAARYVNDVAMWEICNEPNLAAPSPVAIANYIAALPLVYAAIKASAPNVEVCAGGLAGAEKNSTRPGYPGDGHNGAEDFAIAIRDNCAGYYDSLSIHSYTDSGTTGWTTSLGASWHTRTICLNIIALGFTRIHITELGMPTGTSSLTEANQYKWLVESYAEIKTWPEVASVYWYSPYNRQAEGVTNQDWYGLWRASFAPKLAYHKFADLVALENAASPGFSHWKGEGNATIDLFRRVREVNTKLRTSLSYEAVSLPAGVSLNTATGVLTITDATITPQSATACVVRVRHANGYWIDYPFTLTVYHPDLQTGSNFDAAGNVTTWQAASANATVAFDFGQRALRCAITGAGGGWIRASALSGLTDGGVYQRGILMKKDTYSGTVVNTSVNSVAQATAPTGADYAWTWLDYTLSGSTTALMGCARNGSPTGDILVRREAWRLKLT